MLKRNSAAEFSVTLAVALLMSVGCGLAADASRVPSWKGQWSRVVVPGVGGQGAFDPDKPWGLGQQAPLTPEYQKVLADSMSDQAAGGLGNYPPAQCLPSGMPRIMTFGRHEYVITPEETYILLGGGVDHYRRIFTDGRDWPTDLEPTYAGYSIGRWTDTQDGVYTTLEVETRGPFKGPRAFDASGLPLAFDNQSIFKERFFIDKANPNILHDVITVIDHALTRPWTADKRYKRNPNPNAQWLDNFCADGNVNVVVGKENYYLSSDGYLMPAKKDQGPPDLRYFKQSRK